MKFKHYYTGTKSVMNVLKYILYKTNSKYMYFNNINR